MNFKREQVTLLEKNKPFVVLQNVKDTYPNISSQSVILSQIKRMYLSDPKHRVKEYDKKIQELQKQYSKSKELQEFIDLEPYKQDKVQKKIRNGKLVYNKEMDAIIESIPLFDKDIDKYIKLPSKDSKQLRRTQMLSLHNKHYNIKIIQGDTLLQDVLPFLESKNPKEYIVAVLLATGRRQNELVSGTITKSKKGAYFAIFSGQSKTGLDLQRDSYEIPLLAPFPVVENAWNLSKTYFENVTDRNTFKIRIRNITRYIKNQPYPIDKLHECRSIYALLCYELFPTGTLSQMAYISSVLGETSINIAAHYNSIKVENITKLWLPCSQQYHWNGNDLHTKEVVEHIETFVMDECMKQKKKTITKALLGRISGKSQNVVKRFYDTNVKEIEKYNNRV